MCTLEPLGLAHARSSLCFGEIQRTTCHPDVYQPRHTMTSSRSGILSIVPFLWTQTPAAYVFILQG